MQVANPEVELERLFDRLVGREKRPRKRAPRAKSLFAKVLRQQELIDKVRNPVEVRLPGIDTVLKAEFGYKNGHYNVIDPVDFMTEQGWLKLASARAVEGRALARVSGSEHGPMALVVVGRFAEQTQRHRPAVRTILSEHGVRLHDFQHLDPLLADIKKHVYR